MLIDRRQSLLALLLGCDSESVSTVNTEVQVTVSHSVNKLNNTPFISFFPLSISLYTPISRQDTLGSLPKYIICTEILYSESVSGGTQTETLIDRHV